MANTDLRTIIADAYKKDWDLINAFTVEFLGAGIINILNENKLDSTAFDEAINSSIISVDTPQFNSQNIEAFVGGEWRLGNGRDEVYRFSVTFRDFNHLSLYRLFTKMYFKQRQSYFNNVAFTVILSKAVGLNSFSDGRKPTTDKKVFQFDETMIDSISQLQFSNNTEAQIAEFTVQFKSGKPQWASNINLK
jgi:hypothetical protein